MPGKICYLGDGHLQGAAAYLAGILLHHGISFDHVPSAESPPGDFASKPYAAYVISDYPSAQLGHAAMQHIAARVEQGAGLVMLGGWESFHGLLGEYHESPLAGVLPVVMQSCDDRRNFFQPCLIEKVTDHAILAGLPWDQPAGIGGINLVTARPDAETVLAAVQFSVLHSEQGYKFTPAGRGPAADRRPAWRGPDCGADDRRGAPLGRRFRRLGRPARCARRFRRRNNRSGQLVRSFFPQPDCLGRATPRISR